MKDEKFGHNYFDSGIKKKGLYVQYSLQSRYPFLRFLAEKLTTHFHPMKVLDLGCAKGFLVLAFREFGVEAYGVDASSYALSCADRRIARYLRQADLGEDILPFQADSFDLIIAHGVLEYVSKPEHAVGEAARVLRPNGIFLLYVSYYNDENDTLRVSVRNRGDWIETMRQYGFQFMPDAGGLCKELSQNQLIGISIESIAKGKILKHLPLSLAQIIYREIKSRKHDYLFFRLE